MSEHGYCTVADVRRVMQENTQGFEAEFGGSDVQMAVDAIVGLSDDLEKTTHKHWYVPGGITEDTEDVVSTDPLSRDDEHDLRTWAAYVDETGEAPRKYNPNSDALLESAPNTWPADRAVDVKERIKLSFGDLDEDGRPAYTRIQLERKDVVEITELMVVNTDGGFDDWTGAGYDGGVGNSFRGDDWWVRVNNRGISQLNLDVHAIDDDPASLANAVYIAFDYGQDSLPKGVRRGVAFLAAADLVVDDEFLAGLPDNGGIINPETKAERWERRGKELLSNYYDADPDEVIQGAGA